MRMVWSDLLFLHWPIDANELQNALPEPLEADLFRGQAWLSIVPFRMSGVRPVLAPSVPGLSAFLEINVRTYVIHQGEPGVFFFSLDASSPIAVWFARTFFHLPYFRARIQMGQRGESTRFASHRTHQGTNPADFDCAWVPGKPITGVRPGGLIHFLTERFQLYAANAGRVYSCRVWHEPWSLREAKIGRFKSSMIEAAGLPTPAGDPLAQHADALAVDVWPQHERGLNPDTAALLDPALDPPPASFSG